MRLRCRNSRKSLVATGSQERGFVWEPLIRPVGGQFSLARSPTPSPKLTALVWHFLALLCRRYGRRGRYGNVWDCIWALPLSHMVNRRRVNSGAAVCAAICDFQLRSIGFDALTAISSSPHHSRHAWWLKALIRRAEAQEREKKKCSGNRKMWILRLPRSPRFSRWRSGYGADFGRVLWTRTSNSQESDGSFSISDRPRQATFG